MENRATLSSFFSVCVSLFKVSTLFSYKKPLIYPTASTGGSPAFSSFLSVCKICFLVKKIIATIINRVSGPSPISTTKYLPSNRDWHRKWTKLTTKTAICRQSSPLRRSYVASDVPWNCSGVVFDRLSQPLLTTSIAFSTPLNLLQHHCIWTVRPVFCVTPTVQGVFVFHFTSLVNHKPFDADCCHTGTVSEIFLPQLFRRRLLASGQDRQQTLHTCYFWQAASAGVQSTAPAHSKCAYAA